MLRSVVLSAVLLSIPTSTPALGKEAPAKPEDPAADINKPQPGARRIAFTAEPGHLDLARRLAGRRDHRLRPSRRPLLAADRRRHGDAAHLRARPGTRSRAIRPTARRSPSPATAAASTTSGPRRDGPPGRTRARSPRRRTLYIRTADWTPDGEFLVARREDGKLAGIPPVELYRLQPARRLGRQAHELGRHAQRLGPVRLRRRPLHLLRAPPAPVQLHPEPAGRPLADRAPRPA